MTKTKNKTKQKQMMIECSDFSNRQSEWVVLGKNIIDLTF